MAFLKPAGVQNFNFTLGDLGAYLALDQGPLNGTGQVRVDMSELYGLIDTGNLSGTPPLSSTTSNLTIQWFYGRDSGGGTGYSPYYKSNLSGGSANTFNFGIYGNQCPPDRLSWGVPNVGTTRDYHGHIISVNTTTGIRRYASACCTNGWRQGFTIYTISGSLLQSSNCLSLFANGNVLDTIPVGGALGAAWSPILNVTSGYGMVATTNDAGYYNLQVAMYAWDASTITPSNSNVTSVSSGFPYIDNSFVNPEDALYVGQGEPGYDVVAILVNRQWQGHTVIFIKRNGTSISSMAAQNLMSPGQYQDYVVQNDNMQAALAWDNVNSKMYSFYLYWGDPGPHNSGAVIAKFDVNLNGTGTVSTSNMTTWKMYDAFQNPGMRSAGCTIIYNDGVNNYIAVVYNYVTGGQWYVYMRIYTNNPGTNTYNLLNSTTYTVFGPGALFNNGGERIHVERMANTQIVNSGGTVTSNLVNFMISYVSDDSNTVIRWYQFDPNSNAITLKDTTTLSTDYRGLLSHNYSALTGQWFNSSLVVSGPAVGGTPRDTYPWNGNKVYNHQGVSDNSTMVKIT
jgi:hypothetical protein